VGSVHRNYTPNSASWLNQAEIAISLFSRLLGPTRMEIEKPCGKNSILTAHNRNRVTSSGFTRKKARHKFCYKITASRTIAPCRFQVTV